MNMGEGSLFHKLLLWYAVIASSAALFAIGWFVHRNVPLGHSLTTRVDSHLHTLCRPVVVCEPRDPGDILDPENQLHTEFQTLDVERGAGFIMGLNSRPKGVTRN